MRIEVLGAAGAHPVPRPFCRCPVCAEARIKGLPYSRYGPSLFFHDLALLVDTPEEIAVQLNRAHIAHVEAAIFSHWHPDHTAGSRVFEANLDPDLSYAIHPRNACTTVFLPARIAETFADNHGLLTRMRYLESRHAISLNIVPMGDSIAYKSAVITPFLLAEDICCGYVIEQDGKRALVCIDELYQWTPPAWLGPLDVAFMASGIFEFEPFTGRRRIPEAHPILRREATFAQTLAMISALDVKRVVFVHLNHSDELGYAQHQVLGARLTAEAGGKPHFAFAHDGMIIEV